MDLLYEANVAILNIQLACLFYRLHSTQQLRQHPQDRQLIDRLDFDEHEPSLTTRADTEHEPEPEPSLTTRAESEPSLNTRADPELEPEPSLTTSADNESDNQSDLASFIVTPPVDARLSADVESGAESDDSIILISLNRDTLSPDVDSGRLVLVGPRTPQPAGVESADDDESEISFGLSALFEAELSGDDETEDIRSLIKNLQERLEVIEAKLQTGNSSGSQEGLPIEDGTFTVEILNRNEANINYRGTSYSYCRGPCPYCGSNLSTRDPRYDQPSPVPDCLSKNERAI